MKESMTMSDTDTDTLIDGKQVAPEIRLDRHNRNYTYLSVSSFTGVFDTFNEGGVKSTSQPAIPGLRARRRHEKQESVATRATFSFISIPGVTNNDAN